MLAYFVLIYSFFNDFLKAHRFFVIAFLKLKNLIAFSYDSQFFIAYVYVRFFFVIAFSYSPQKMFAFLLSLATIQFLHEGKKYLWAPWQDPASAFSE